MDLRPRARRGVAAGGDPAGLSDGASCASPELRTPAARISRLAPAIRLQPGKLAAEAGRLGGQHSHGGTSSEEDGKQGGRGGNFADDRERAAEAGRKGGERSQGG